FEEALDDRSLVNGAAARGFFADEAREVNARARNSVRDEREREVQSFEERARVDPVRRRVRVARGRDVAVERLAHLRDPLYERGARVRLSAERAYGAHGKLERRLDLRAARVRRVELRRREDRAQSRPYVAVRLVEGVGDSRDERLARFVRDEVAAQLRRDELGGRGVRDEYVQDLLAVLHASAARNLLAEHNLLAVVVEARREEEGAGAAVLSGVVAVDAAAARLVDSPAGERARNLLHVLLRVAAVNAQRVQLHQLACVVLVDAALLSLLWSLLRRLSLLLLPRHLCLTTRARFAVA